METLGKSLGYKDVYKFYQKPEEVVNILNLVFCCQSK